MKRQGQEIALDPSTVDWNVQGAYIFLFSNKSFYKATCIILLCLEDTLRLPLIIFHHNNKKEGKIAVTASWVQGFPNNPATFPDLQNSMTCRFEEIAFSELHLYSPNETETDSCDAPACWTEFSEWSACEGMCGSSGSQSRTRSCIEPTEGGQPCPEESTETATQECNTTGLWASALNQPPM